MAGEGKIVIQEVGLDLFSPFCLNICVLCVQKLELQVHGRGRDHNSLDDLLFGVNQEMLYAQKIQPVEGVD